MDMDMDMDMDMALLLPLPSLINQDHHRLFINPILGFGFHFFYPKHKFVLKQTNKQREGTGLRHFFV